MSESIITSEQMIAIINAVEQITGIHKTPQETLDVLRDSDSFEITIKADGVYVSAVKENIEYRTVSPVPVFSGIAAEVENNVCGINSKRPQHWLDITTGLETTPPTALQSHCEPSPMHWSFDDLYIGKSNANVALQQCVIRRPDVFSTVPSAVWYSFAGQLSALLNEVDRSGKEVDVMAVCLKS